MTLAAFLNDKCYNIMDEVIKMANKKSNRKAVVIALVGFMLLSVVAGFILVVIDLL